MSGFFKTQRGKAAASPHSYVDDGKGGVVCSGCKQPPATAQVGSCPAAGGAR